jgi:hypothetical protein
MNSFAVLDSPESDTGVKTRSKQRRKSKGKESLEEGSPSDLKSPKSSRKKKDKSKDHGVKQEVNGSPLEVQQTFPLLFSVNFQTSLLASTGSEKLRASLQLH